ncbi:TcpD family membrane protein [Streptococcus sobrinus]|uniref:TcpD family membrane protein n=1 Tax=Streptococcus sobrinus TaxID=1310 RepID=UPI0003787704|nr:TcpD family membrane protein [Streptococcus sobrinus]
MDGGTLYNYLFNNFGVYVIAGVAFYVFCRGISKGSMAESVLAIVLGSFAYWFAKDPASALGSISQIWNKIKGGS